MVSHKKMEEHEAEMVTSKRSIKIRRCYTPEPPSPKLSSVDVDRARTSIRRKRKRLSDPVKAKLCTLQEAEAIQSSLDPKMPSFLKCMQRAHVSCSFWMGVPLHFCKLHLPKQDTLMTLVDENGDECSIKYLAENPALSGGWRAFSMGHKLAVGDVLIFHLIEPTKFKVYITRAILPEDGALVPSDVDAHAEPVPGPLDIDANGKQDTSEEHSAGKGIRPTEIPRLKCKIEEHDAEQVPGLLDIDASAKQDSCIKATGKHTLKRKSEEHNAGKDIKRKYMKITIKSARRCQGSLSSPILDDKKQSSLNLAEPTEQSQHSLQGKDLGNLNLVVSTGQSQNSLPVLIVQEENKNILDLGVLSGQNGNDPDMLDSEGLHGIKSSGSTIEFKDMKNLESFTIKVNGLTIDPEISEYTRIKYHELCCTQNALLHEHLVERINSKLVAGIISETVNIADSIQASNLSTSKDDFTTWSKSLMAFEHMGMNVRFLRSRLQRLETIAFESELAKDSKRYKEALVEQAHKDEEIKTIEAKLVELKESSKMLQAEAETLKVKAKEQERKFEAEVSAPW